MKKRLLAKVPIQEASSEYVSLAKRIKKEKYLVSAEKIEVEERGILLMYFYDLTRLREENTKAIFRVFLANDDYITQDLDSTTIKWKTGSIGSLVHCYYGAWWYNDCILVDDESSEAIKEFLNTKGDPLEEIDNFQEKIMAARLAIKHQKIKDRIDKQMKKVPELPKDFDEWIEYTAMFHSRYIYYTYKARKRLDGYCTHCRKDVVVESPRHNKKGICPNCKSPITFKAMGNSKRVSDKGQATLIQKVDDGIVVRYFSISKYYDDHYKEPQLYYDELSRDFYDKEGKIESYEYFNFKQTGEVRWCDGQGKFGFHKAVLYEKNLDEVLKGTIWEYSAIKEFATNKKGFGFPVYDYLERYKEYPSIEYLVKLKLYKLTDQFLHPYWGIERDINLKGKNLKEVLNINKSQLTIAKRINAGAGELTVIREAAKANLSLTDEQILFIAKHARIEGIVEISQYTTVYKMTKYIEIQATKEKDKKDIGDTFRDWIDYIDNCKILKYDLKNEFVLFPRDLKEVHDRTYKLVQENKNELLDRKIKDLSNEIGEFYNWQYKNYLIMVPGTAEEIIKEGQMLHHCVGTYIERVAKGKTIVLFLRKKEKPQEPYYTVEVNPTDFKVEQCRGKYNKSMTREIKKIIDKFSEDKLKSLYQKKAG